MKALVVYESWFGNTRAIAEVVARVLGDGGVAVELADVTEGPTLADDLDLLVAGAPTQAFGLSRPVTRKAAAEQAGGAATAGIEIGMREWLEQLPQAPAGERPLVAAFDTRVKKPLIPGSAARGIAKRLRRRGYRSAVGAETFWVADTPGPLRPGEAERVATWASELLQATERPDRAS
jgi:hypothetical protein